jgi:hypothetical protein
MRFVVAACLIVSSFAFATLAPAQTPPAPTGGIRVEVSGHRDVHGSTPNAPPGSASVQNMTPTLGGSGQTVDLGANGRADVGGLADGLYRVTVTTGDRTGTTYVQVKDGKTTTAAMGAQGLPQGATVTRDPQSLLDAARNAALACDRVAYDDAVRELERAQSMAEINLRDLNRIIEEYGQISQMGPDLPLLQRTRDNILRDVMGGGGRSLRDANRANAPVNQGLRVLPQYIAALEEKARLEARLNAIRAARQQVPPFPENCDKRVGFLGDGKGRFGVSFEAGFIGMNLPNYKAYALEANAAVVKTDLLNNNRTVTGHRIGGDGFFYIPGTETIMRVNGSITDLDSRQKLDMEIMPTGTERFLFQSPGGGFSTGAAVDGFRIEQELRQYQLGVRAERLISASNLLFRPYIGAQFSYIDAKDNSEFDIGGNFAHFEDRRSLDTYGFGPVIGVEVEAPIAGGLYAFGGIGAELRWNSSKARWRTELDVGGTITAQDLKKTDNKFTWGAMGSAGIGYRWDNFDVRLGGTAGISNHYPTLDIDTEIADGDPEISWKSTSMWRAWAKASVRF